ncbi:MAG: TonB family protein [Prevotellaceae bacterium]|jgi:TonB family protein|nr:TonB family protein [Prevotellaceae bacterium]
MKKIGFISAIMLFCLQANSVLAQDSTQQSSSTEMVFQGNSKTSAAQYQGGEEVMYKFIDDSLVYPKSAIDNNVSGRVILRLYISAEGDVKSIAVQQGLDDDCNNAAKECIRKMPKWIPAQQNGRNTAGFATVPVIFKTQQIVYEYEETEEETDYEIYNLFDKKWILVEIEGKEMPVKTPNTPYFRFTFDKKNKKKRVVEGNASCASLSGKYSWNQKNWKLKFNGLVYEKAKCKIGKKDKETKIIDSDFQSILKNCVEYRIENGQLILGKIANDRFKALAKFEYETVQEKGKKK